MMMHQREDSIPTSLSLAGRHCLSGKRPTMILMGIVEHGWNICLPAFGLGGLCVTFGRGPMRIFLLFLPCARVLRQRWLGFRVVRELLKGYLALCPRCARAVQTHPLRVVLHPMCPAALLLDEPCRSRSCGLPQSIV